ncbi:MAG: ABC transporter ATP-binding protein, partial [Ornithinimicrobium sp.]
VLGQPAAVGVPTGGLNGEDSNLPHAASGQPASSTPVQLDRVSASWAGLDGLHRLGADGPRHDLDALDLGPLHTGDRVQLTGPNGVGKSTALAVLARHLDPASGTYLMAGEDTRTHTLASVRSRIAVVDDEPHAFAGTVRANLALALPAARDADMVHALRAADLGRWFAALPDGLDSEVRGLSGGERARLSMARAVLSGRPIVLLDEPTAHLDDATADRALRGVTGGLCSPGKSCAGSVRPSVVAVSHRPLPWTGFTSIELRARDEPPADAPPERPVGVSIRVAMAAGTHRLSDSGLRCAEDYEQEDA